MPLQNRVAPGGEIIATSARGTFLGNRGILHDENKQIVRTSRNTMWLICRLEFNGRKRELMSPGSYTELFFLDEAVALAAGHRPCGECRRTSYRAYIAAADVDSSSPISGSKDLDKQLNESRRTPRTTAAIATLPEGVFIKLGDNDFRLIWDGALHRWSPEGYVDPIAIADIDGGEALVVTPPLSAAALRHGYPVEVHASVIATPRSTTNVSEGPLTNVLIPELQAEIEQHLRANPIRHGEVFRDMERGLSADQMATSRSNATNFMRSVEGMLAGTLPTTRSAALINSYGYRYLLTCNLSPELHSYVKVFLRRLAAVNPEVRVDEPLRIRALPNPGTVKRRATPTQEAVCPKCRLIHAGECD